MPAWIASTTPFTREPANDALETVRIHLIERGSSLGVDVEHAEERTAATEDRNHDL
jgi:hypothetical protein